MIGMIRVMYRLFKKLFNKEVNEEFGYHEAGGRVVPGPIC